MDDDPTNGAERAGLYPEGVVLAYRGKAGCDSIFCEQRILVVDEVRDPGEDCLGWHCAFCDEPCGLWGHGACLDPFRRANG